MKTVLFLGEADLKVPKKGERIGLSSFSDTVLRAESDADIVIYFDGCSSEVLKNRNGPCGRVSMSEDVVQLFVA